MGKKRARESVVEDLAHLAGATPAVRRIRATRVPGDSIQLLCQCCRAVLKGAVALPTPQKESLRPYQKDLRKLASSETGQDEKREILKKGGLLKALVKSGNHE